jgi:hypothetical protein
MAVSLNSGQVVNDCDNASGFSSGSTQTEPSFIQGTAAIGEKVSNSTTDFKTTQLSGGGGTFSFDFSSGGANEGDHLLCWINALTPINATTGIRLCMDDNSVGTGVWGLAPASNYTGGFIPRVIDTAADFTSVTGSFTTTGNPAQLNAVDEVGGGFTTITMISGNFANVLIDQFTIGTGLRVDGTSNTWSTIETAEASNVWGWQVEQLGAYIWRGGVYLGPSTGTATSSFTDTGQVVTFAAENVATGFYDINIRGANTTITFTQHVISSEDPAIARWNLTLDGTSIPTFDDSASLFKGFDVITLQAGSTLDGTTLDNGNSIIQNGATITNCSISNANTADGVALIQSDNLANISNCNFTFSDGHAIEITTAGTYSFSGNTFTGYGADGTNDAAIYNNSGGLVTINSSNNSGITVRNGAGATTTVVDAVTVSVTGVSEGTSVQVLANETAGTVTKGDVLGFGLADASGEFSFSINYEGAFGAGLDVIIRCRNQGFPNAGIADDGGVFTDETTANNSAVENDITLMPSGSAATNDAYYWGHGEKFNQLKLEVSQAASTGYCILDWEYWNGSVWTALSNVVDNTDEFETSGLNVVSWDEPTGWATTSVNSQGPYYYVRARNTGLPQAGTQPLGRKVKLDVTRYLPFTQNNTITNSGLNVVAVWIEDTISIF